MPLRALREQTNGGWGMKKRIDMLKYPTMVQCLVISGAFGALVGCSDADKVQLVPIDGPDSNLPRFNGSALVDEGGAVLDERLGAADLLGELDVGQHEAEIVLGLQQN